MPALDGAYESAAGKGAEGVRVILHGSADRVYREAHVPERFSSMVTGHVAHVLMNSFDARFGGNPVFLMVEGSPGSGKTFQTLSSCVQSGCDVVYCSAAGLTGSKLGQSASMFTELYQCAITLLEGGSSLPVIVLDDFHMGEAAVAGNMSTTVNSSLLTGRMMNMCDGDYTKIPIIVTGNSFANVDAALMRHGRSRVFRWEPSKAEKEEVVASILAGAIDRQGSDRLVRTHKGRSVAFFAAALEEARMATIREKLRSGVSLTQLVRFPSESGLGASPTEDALVRAIGQMERADRA